ncbi:MAG: hypothetical protein ACOH2F_13745 [Cellulomonas sp.]
MRWEALFADMEAQLEAAQAAERALEVADLTRAERASVALGDRLRAAHGASVQVTVAGGHRVDGELIEVAEQWLLVAEGVRRALVPLAAVVAVRGLPARSIPAHGEVARRLGLGYALRAIARDRATVRIAADGSELTGRIEWVGADHLELAAGFAPHAEVDPGGSGRWAVPFTALRVVRSD